MIRFYLSSWSQILWQWDFVSCMPVFALIRHQETEGTIFIVHCHNWSVPICLFSICLFCSGLLCFVRSIYVWKRQKKNTFNVQEVCGNYLVQSTKNGLYCTLKAWTLKPYIFTFLMPQCEAVSDVTSCAIDMDTVSKNDILQGRDYCLQHSMPVIVVWEGNVISF